MGLGTSRDGSFNPGAPAFYGAITAVDLIFYANVKISYAKYADVGLHFNTEWTADPNLTQQSMPGDKSFAAAQQAHLSVAGVEANLRAPYWGHLWISPLDSQCSKWLGAGQRGDRGHALAERRRRRHQLHGLYRQPDRLDRQRIDVQSRLPLREHALRDPGQRAGECARGDGELLRIAGGRQARICRQRRRPSCKTRSNSSSTGPTRPSRRRPGSPSCFDTTPSITTSAPLDTCLRRSRRGSSSPRTSSPASASTFSTLATSTATRWCSPGRGPGTRRWWRGATSLQQGPYAGMTPDQNVVKLQAEIAF